MHSIKRSFLFVCLLTLALSCGKNSDIFTEYYPIETLYQSLAPEPAVAAVEQQQGGSLYGDTGLKIVVAPNSLVDGNGSTPEGTVQVAFQHLTTIADYLRNDLNTQSQGIVLDIESMVYLSFDVEGDRLQPTEASEESVQIYVPVSELSASNNLYEWSDNGWRVVSEGLESVTFATKIGSVETTTTGYAVNARTASWLAIGRPIMNSDSESTLSVTLPENHNSVNSVVYATIPGNSSLLSFEYDNEKAFFYTSVGGISTNVELELFSITAQGEQDRYDFGTQSVRLTTGTTVALQPNPRSLEDIQSYINSL